MEDKIYYGRVEYYDPDKGYGQIMGNDGIECFVHKSDVVDGGLSRFKFQSVSYSKRDEGKRRPRAINVKPLG
jgi:cold shock CspA family protein